MFTNENKTLSALMNIRILFSSETYFTKHSISPDRIISQGLLGFVKN